MGAIESLARAHSRVVLTEDLLGAGVSTADIERERRLGRLVRLIRGAYAVTPYASDVAVLTAVAATRRYRLAAVSCESALVLLGCDIPFPVDVHLTGSLPKPVGTPGVRVHASRHALPTVTVADLPVVSGALALIGAWSDLPDLGSRRAAACAAIAAGATTTAEVLALDPGARRVRGAADLVASCGYAEMGCESPPEIAYLVDVELAHRLPTASARQHWINLPDGRRRRVDVVYLDARLIIEIDGRHHDDPATARHDAGMDAMLGRLGWRVIRFTARDIMLRPSWVAAQVRSALLAAA